VLSSGPADQSNDRRGRDRHEAHLEPPAVVCADGPFDLSAAIYAPAS
jgi:hypothetical protein